MTSFCFFTVRKGNKNSEMLIIGVTGGIGSGKSEVCRIFRSLGAMVVSADDLAREIMESNGEVRKEIEKAFGKDIYTVERKLSRKKLATAVFSSEISREKINATVHPHVLETMQQIIDREKLRHRSRLLLFEAALFYESGADKMMDYMIVVDADENVRIRRAIRRDESSRQEVLQRIKAQMRSEHKVRKGDFVIHNNGDIQTLKSIVRFLYDLLLRINASTSNGGR